MVQDGWDELFQVDGLSITIVRPFNALQSRQVEQISSQAHKSIHVAAENVERLPVLPGGAIPAVGDLYLAHQNRKRCPQLVRRI